MKKSMGGKTKTGRKVTDRGRERTESRVVGGQERERDERCRLKAT